MDPSLKPSSTRARSHRARWLWLLLPIGLAAPIIVVTVYFSCGFDACPDIDRLQAYQPGAASQLLDRDGNVFAELKPAEGDTAPLATVPMHVRDAFLAVEDRRFHQHGGIDWRRVGGAVLANVRAGGVAQGSSTITMQLARNVFPDRLPASARTMKRKALEVRVAYAIEDRYSKDEILELYLSHVYFGNGARGIDAASRHYFGASPPQLTIAQGALLAALLKAPTSYDPRRAPDAAKKRRDLVLTLMERQGRVSETAATAARGEKLGIVRAQRGDGQEHGLAPWFVEEVRRRLEDEIGELLYEGNLVVETTLDAGLQRASEEELAQTLGAVASTGEEQLQGAVVALHAATGDVLAWVGGRDFAASRFDRVKNARRQAGSAFKPFVYAAALEQGRALSDRLLDKPMTIQLDRNKEWKPKNFDGRFEGAVTMRDALVRSKNVPTIHLGGDVGLEAIERVAKKCGIAGEMDKTPAMPLGTVTVSPLELASAYMPFATLGETVEPRFILAVRTTDGDALWSAAEPKRRRVLPTGVAYLVTSALQDAVKRGTGKSVRRAGFQHAAAGKTGTTSGALDAWFVGYTPDVVAAVWLGFDKPQTITWDTTGGRLAAPIWGRIMARGGAAASDWVRPADVVARQVDAATGGLIAKGCGASQGRAYEELFLGARLPAEVCPTQGDLLIADGSALGDGVDLDEDDDAALVASEVWPGEYNRSESAPPAELEEAERGRRPVGDEDLDRAPARAQSDRERYVEEARVESERQVEAAKRLREGEDDRAQEREERAQERAPSREEREDEQAQAPEERDEREDERDREESEREQDAPRERARDGGPAGDPLR